MKTEIISLIVASTIAVIAIVTGVTYYNLKRDEAMKSNIESAIVKGIDPIAVKCAYSSSVSDTTCAVYAANRK